MPLRYRLSRANHKTLIAIPKLEKVDIMPAKWQLFIDYGQKTILELQETDT